MPVIQRTQTRSERDAIAESAILDGAVSYARANRVAPAGPGGGPESGFEARIGPDGVAYPGVGRRQFSSTNPAVAGRGAYAPGDPFDEVGEHGLAFSSGHVTQEFLRSLQRDHGIATYTEMSSNDAILGGVIHAINQMMRKVTWSIDPNPGSEKDPTDKQLKYAHFLASCFNDMSTPWQDVLTEILSMLVYGWSFFEVVYKTRRGDDPDPRFNSKHNDGKVGIRKIASRSQETLDRWAMTPQGEILGMWQRPHPYSDFPVRPHDIDGQQPATSTSSPYDVSFGDHLGQSVFLPLKKGLLFRTTVSRNSPEGRSILRSAYRSWYIKKNLEDIMVIGVERDLVGVPSMKAPLGFDPLNNTRDAQVLSQVQAILTNIRNDEQAGIVVPPGWEFLLVASPGKKEFEIPDLLQYYDKRMAMTVLGQFILLGMERVGSFALSKNSTDVFSSSMTAWVQSIADVINRYLIDELLYMNVMDDLDDPPRFVAGNIKDADINDLSNYVTRLINVDALTPDDSLEKTLREVGGLNSVPPQTGLIRVAKQLQGQEQSRKRLTAAGKVQGSAGGPSSGGPGGSNGGDNGDDDRDNEGRSRGD